MSNFTTIVRTAENRVVNTETVYRTAKTIEGAFSADNILHAINIQLAPAEELTPQQVKSALNQVAAYGTRLVKINANWYRWK